MQALHDSLQEPHWRSEFGRRKKLWHTMSKLGLTGLHTAPTHRRWLDVQRLDMPLNGLPAELEGLRIVQISDLHVSPFVWRSYLRQQLRHVIHLQPDLLVVPGDLISGGYRYARFAADLLDEFQPRPPLGIVCILGNHDYGMNAHRNPREARQLADRLVEHLAGIGIPTLRNERLTPTPGLHLIGLDDIWTGRLDAETAFDGVPSDGAIVCLNHDPKNARELLDYPWQWMLSGHTHGRQLAETKLGKVFNKKRRRPFVRGHYELEPGKDLYVNRGLSYGQRWQSWCKPEITVFHLTRRDSTGDTAKPEAKTSAQ